MKTPKKARDQRNRARIALVAVGIVVACTSLGFSIVQATVVATKDNLSAARSLPTPSVVDLNFDSRSDRSVHMPKVTIHELSHLKQRLPKLVSRMDPLTGTVKYLVRLEGRLTSSEKGSPGAIAQRWLRANYVLLGLTHRALSTLRIQSVEKLPLGYVRVTYRQSYKGITAFDNRLSIILNHNAIFAVEGSPAKQLSVTSIKPHSLGFHRAPTGSEWSPRKLDSNRSSSLSINRCFPENQLRRRQQRRAGDLYASRGATITRVAGFL
jgi:hypothetical protein